MADKLRVEYDELQIHVEGDLDRRGRKGVSEKVSVHFTAVRVQILIGTKMDDKKFDRLKSLVARYCPVDSLFAAAVADYEVTWKRM